MSLTNVKRRESVPGQGIAKLKRREQKTVYSIMVWKYEGHPKNNESCWTSRKPWHVAYWNFTCLWHSPIHTFKTKMSAIGWRHTVWRHPDWRQILDSVRGDTP